MIDLLEPLAQLPGVELALLSTHDGVPIASVGRIAGQSIDESGGGMGMTKDDGLAAMTAAWVGEVAEAVAPLSWMTPARISLRGARGVLVLQRMETALLVVLLARGLTAEDVRLSMEGTIARVERTLRQVREPAPVDVPAPMPATTEIQDPSEPALESEPEFESESETTPSQEPGEA